MDQPAIRGDLAAQDAAEALIALGWPIEPTGDDMDLWHVADFILTDDELIDLAVREGIQPPADRVQ